MITRPRITFKPNASRGRKALFHTYVWVKNIYCMANGVYKATITGSRLFKLAKLFTSPLEVWNQCAAIVLKGTGANEAMKRTCYVEKCSTFVHDVDVLAG